MRKAFDVNEAWLELRQNLERPIGLMLGARTLGNIRRPMVGSLRHSDRSWREERRAILVGCLLIVHPAAGAFIGPIRPIRPIIATSAVRRPTPPPGRPAAEVRLAEAACPRSADCP